MLVCLFLQVGFAVVYNLLAFPKGRRKKVGQIFVMPNHQGARVGTKILKAVHKVAENVDVVDVTVSISRSVGPMSAD